MEGVPAQNFDFIPSEVRALEGLEQRDVTHLHDHGRPLVAAASTICGGRGMTRTRGQAQTAQMVQAPDVVGSLVQRAGSGGGRRTDAGQIQRMGNTAPISE